MRTTRRRRTAHLATVALATLAVMAPARPAAASIDQDAIFLASPTSDQVVVLAGGKRTSVTAFPTERVLAGHFTSKAGMHGHDVLYWYGPGSNPEKIWLAQGSKVATGTMPAVNGTYRVLRDAEGRSLAEEVLFLGPGTTARTMQLAPEHSPTLGTVTPITGLPDGYRGASTWFEQPVD